MAEARLDSSPRIRLKRSAQVSSAATRRPRGGLAGEKVAVGLAAHLGAAAERKGRSRRGGEGLATVRRSGSAKGSASRPRKRSAPRRPRARRARSRPAQSAISASSGASARYHSSMVNSGWCRAPRSRLRNTRGEIEDARLAGRQQLLHGEFRRGMQIGGPGAPVRADHRGGEGVQMRLIARRDLQGRGLDLGEALGARNSGARRWRSARARREAAGGRRGGSGPPGRSGLQGVRTGAGGGCVDPSGLWPRDVWCAPHSRKPRLEGKVAAAAAPPI